LEITTERASIVVPVESITSIRMPFHPPPDLTDSEQIDQKLRSMFVRRKKIESLEITYKNLTKADSRADLSFLASGISWTPSYQLLLNSERAKLSLQCTVLNEFDTFDARTLVLAASPPTLKYSNVVDPIASKDSLKEFLSDPIKRKAFLLTSSSNSQEAPNSTPSSLSPPFFADICPESFIFNDISLRKNDRILLPVFTHSVPCQMDYHCSIPASAAMGLQPVTASLQIMNRTAEMWPAAPVFILHEPSINSDEMGSTKKTVNSSFEHIVAQVNLEAVSPGGSALLKDILVSELINVELKEETVEGDQIRVLILVKNRTEKSLTLNLNHTVNATNVISETVGTTLNNTTTLKWLVELLAQEKKTISFIYKKAAHSESAPQ
jgi:hypothetical protein